MSTFAIDLITGKEFLFNESFINSGTTIFTGITSGNNGISIGAPHQLKLGGTLTCSTVLTRGTGNIAGVEYGGDYSTGYTNRSLVDKGYADTKLKISDFSGFTGTTLPANYFNKSQISVFTGTTLPANYYNKSQINTYTGATKTILNLLETFAGNGVLSGLAISINADPTKIDISSGVACIFHNYSYPTQPTYTQIIYTGNTGIPITYLTTDLVTYLAMDLNGNLIQQTTQFTDDQRRDYVLLGAVIHSNKTTINAINNLPDVLINGQSQLNDLIDALKNFNVEGNIFAANGVNLKINKSIGKIFKRGVNFSIDVKNPHVKTLPALIAPANIRYRLSDGTEYPDTNVVSLFYESPLGTRIPIPSTGFSIQRITIFPTNLTRIQYGQAIYDTLDDAKAALSIEPYTTEQNIAENGLLRAFLIVGGSVTSLEDTNNAVFIETDKFGTMPLGASAGITTLQQMYNNSIIPQIITSTSLGALTLKRGSGADTDNVFDIKNGANSSVAAITGKGQGKFVGGLITSKIRPTGDTTTAIQINKANGTTNIINVDTVSGLTGHGTIAPKGLLHLYGTDNTLGNGFNIQTNNIRIDGSLDADKDVVWMDNGVEKWAAQISRNEEGQFWYLFNPESENNQLVVEQAGRFGINKTTNVISYHTTLIVGNGLDDLIIGGTYTQNYNTVYEIEIVSVTGITDTYHWKKSVDNGITYNSFSPISGCSTGTTLLEHGVTFSFEHLTGHTADNMWRFAAFTQVPQATLNIAPMGFKEVQTTQDYTANPVIYKDITALANGGLYQNQFTIFNTGNTTQAFYWGTTVQVDSIYVNLLTFSQNIQLRTEYWNGTTWVNLNDSNFYIDSTSGLTKSGRLIWTPNTMPDWTKGYIPSLSATGYQLYWMRIITTTLPSINSIARSISVGNDRRFGIYNAFTDYRASYYVDSLGRVNIGGGNITGENRLQVNTANNVQVITSGTDSLVEFDSEDSAVTDLKIKLSSDDALPPGLTFVKTRGSLDNATCTQTGDILGHISFRGRAGTAGRLLAEFGSQFVGTGTTRCGDIFFNTANGSDPVEAVRINYKGNTGFGISAPVAVVHLKAGTTTNAPLKFTAGTLLSVPQVGAVEFDGHCFYHTVSGSTIRKTFAALESPQFSGNTNLPSTTCLNGQSLCNYILYSGGTNNSTLTPRSTFNALTGCSQQARQVLISGATNGITKTDCHNIILGGSLTQDTVITGSTYNITISGKLLNICGTNGIEMIDTSAQGIDISSNGNSVDIRGGTLAGVEKTKLLVSATQATFTDSRTTPNGIQYAADYSATYTDRSLVDKAYVISQASGLIPLAAVTVATTANINIASAPATIGGVTLTNGMRILVKNQTGASTNGIYIFNGAGNPLTRSSDFSGGTTNWKGTYTSVLSGATNKNTSWILNTPNPITIGVTPLTFVLFSSQAGVVGGNGICVTQIGGNNNVAIKLASNCGLCSDASGLYISPTIGGVGICYGTGTLCFDGTNVAGNSLSWSGTQLNVNTTGGTLNTAFNSKLNVSTFNIYSGLTLTNINSRALKTSVATYTGTTAPNTFALKTSVATYTGTTAPSTYVCITNFNTYTGATHTCMDRHAYLSGATFTGVVRAVKPAQNDNSTCVATTSWYISQGSTVLPLMDSNAACGVSNLFARQDHVHPSDTSRVAKTGDTMTGTLIINANLITTGNTFITGNTTIGSILTVIGSTTLKSNLKVATIISGGTCICSPVICGTSCVRSALVCSIGQVKGTILTGSTCSESPVICGTICSDSPLHCGATVLATSCVCSPTICTTTCLCSAGTTRLVGAATAASTLNVSGITRHTTTVCLVGTPATGDIATDRTLFWNPTDKQVKAIKLTGGSDQYFYTERTTTGTTATAGPVVYLSGTPWNFAAGRYQIDFSAIYGNTANNGQTCMEAAVDGVVISRFTLLRIPVVNWSNSWSVSRDVTLTAGCHCLAIRYGAAANTAFVSYGMIRAKRIY